jgi:hypothetical protein
VFETVRCERPSASRHENVSRGTSPKSKISVPIFGPPVHSTAYEPASVQMSPYETSGLATFTCCSMSSIMLSLLKRSAKWSAE